MKSLVNELVNHKKYGTGKVTEQTESKLKIEFEEKTAEFMINTCGTTFVFADDSINSAVLEQLAAEKAAKETREKNIAATMRVSVEIKTKHHHWNNTPLGSKLYCLQNIADAAHTLYDLCCDSFNWDRSKCTPFLKQKSLYAADVTPEHYGCWCLSNSNWTGTKGGIWNNIISNDLETITTIWDEIEDNDFYDDNGTIVVFAKKPDNMYIFLGVYKYTSLNEEKRSKTFVKISDIYTGNLTSVAA